MAYAMRKLRHQLIEHLLEVAWAYFIICLFLAGLALAFGRFVGFEITSLVCAGFALMIAAIFAVIVATNLAWIGVVRIWIYFCSKRRQ